MSELPELVPAVAHQPEALVWPTHEWPLGEASNEVRALVDEGFDDAALAETHAVVVVQHGRLIAERYGGALPHFDRPATPVEVDTPLISWSMAKSMTHYLVGVLVGEGRLDPDARAPVPEWADPSDPRHDITLGDLLAMRDGLDFVEDYVDGESSHVIEMLFGSGREDTGGFAAARPAKHPAGTVYNYSSGTTNIISRIVADVVGRGEPYREFVQRHLFDPLGMDHARITLDDSGVFVGSSYVYAPAREMIKFGYLYLRGGLWDGRQLVSRTWTDTAQVPLSYDPDMSIYYAWQWWVTGDRHGTYMARGYEGQRMAVIPSLDAVVLRLGRTSEDSYALLDAWGNRLIDALAH